MVIIIEYRLQQLAKQHMNRTHHKDSVTQKIMSYSSVITIRRDSGRYYWKFTHYEKLMQVSIFILRILLYFVSKFCSIAASLWMLRCIIEWMWLFSYVLPRCTWRYCHKFCYALSIFWGWCCIAIFKYTKYTNSF